MNRRITEIKTKSGLIDELVEKGFFDKEEIRQLQSLGLLE